MVYDISKENLEGVFMNEKLIMDYIKQNFIWQNNEKDVLLLDCEIIKFMLKNCEVVIQNENRFFGNIELSKVQPTIIAERAKLYQKIVQDHGLSLGEQVLAHTGSYDFSHTTAEWDTLLSLGIYGIRKRLYDYSIKPENTADQARFYNALLSVYDGVLEFMLRVSNQAFALGKNEMAQSLKDLTTRAPVSLYEVMQTTIVYYYLQHIFDGTYLRTLGRLDSLYFSYYKNENKDTANKLLFDFIREIDRLKAPSNIPFAIGGTDINGNSLINELSYEILDVYKKANTINTKFHLLCSNNTPLDIIESALDGVRNGNNSIVFMSDEQIIKALLNLGEDKNDAVNYHVVGCYECGGFGELTCSCNARVNLPKALELAINDGKDMLSREQVGLVVNSKFDTFDDVYNEFVRQAKHLCFQAMKTTDIYESNYNKLHSAPILSANYTCALDKGGDLYCDYTAKYNNSSLNVLGLATAVDSLLAIKKAVFDENRLSLNEFVDILKSDWIDNEILRLTIKNKYPKYGTNNSEADYLAKDIINQIATAVNGAQNVKGGVYRLGAFSIDWRWSFGEKTAASANGRKCGETISQNTGATFGADTKGATAHLLSVASINTINTPNGSIADIDLHSSAVVGKKGLNALVSTLKTYFSKGGFAVHFNVLDTEKLKDAKSNPEKYPNLQVRLCGWNVLFNSLSEKEKEEFINRSIKG